jgi:hypothetical protein
MYNIVSSVERDRLKNEGHLVTYEWVDGNPCDATYDWVHVDECDMCWIELFIGIRKVYGQDVSNNLAILLDREWLTRVTKNRTF